jgi:hypothetical protein
MSHTGSFYSIQTFNPFEATHPGHKVVSEDALTLIKVLREQGHKVVIEPDDSRPVEYLFRKGFREFFMDPLVINFGLGVAASVVAAAVVGALNWVWQHRRRESLFQSPPKPSNLLLRSNEEGLIFSYSGEPLDSEALGRLLAVVEQDRSEFHQASLRRSPLPDRPVPVFLEHSALIVGWCRLSLDSRGIYVEDAAVTPSFVWRRIESGELKGLSITGIASKSICSVCRGSYVDCNHISGVEYDSVYCSNEIRRATFINVNIVSSPVNQQCFLQMISSAKGG